MKKGITTLLFSFVLIFCCFGGFNVLAAEQQKENKPTEGIESDDPIIGVGGFENINLRLIQIESTTLFLRGEAKIDITSGSATVTGNTLSRQTVDSIGVHLYLQKWNSSNSTWVNTVDAGEFLRLNNSSAFGERKVSTTGAGYYRTKAEHKITHRGEAETRESFSTYIYINQ